MPPPGSPPAKPGKLPPPGKPPGNPPPGKVLPLPPPPGSTLPLLPVPPGKPPPGKPPPLPPPNARRNPPGPPANPPPGPPCPPAGVGVTEGMAPSCGVAAVATVEKNGAARAAPSPSTATRPTATFGTARTRGRVATIPRNPTTAMNGRRVGNQLDVRPSRTTLQATVAPSPAARPMGPAHVARRSHR